MYLESMLRAFRFSEARLTAQEYCCGGAQTTRALRILNGCKAA
jgi:hypothetical protein